MLHMTAAEAGRHGRKIAEDLWFCCPEIRRPMDSAVREALAGNMGPIAKSETATIVAEAAVARWAEFFTTGY